MEKEIREKYYYANDRAIMLYGVSRGIAGRKRADAEMRFQNEELLKINAEKDKFFSIIAHDLRGPLGGFLGMTELMAEELSGMTKDEIQQMVFLMRNSATNLFCLLGNLLEWSRMQRGFAGFVPVSILLMPKISEIMALVLDGANKKKITISYVIPDDLKVFADVNMFEVIIRNLVSNAVKFTPVGGCITVTATAVLAKSVEISIKDTGIGMNKHMIDHLFQLDKTTNRKGTEGEDSTGLGLILCRDFIEKHSGRLRIESEEGKGSTFCFSLPTNTDREVTTTNTIN